jgi:hypothetical protein
MAGDVTTEEVGEETTEVSTDTTTKGEAEETATGTEETTAEEWFLSEGVKGEGEVPEWYDKKYKNISEQAKGYKELSKKLGAFTGAPEEYEVNISGSAKERGLELDNDSPLLKAAIEFGQENGVNQEGFDKLLRLYELNEIGNKEMQQKFVDDQMTELGDRGQIRISDLQKWGSANLPEDLVDGFESMFRTAGSVEAMEHIVSQIQGAAVSPSDTVSAAGYTAADVEKLQFEKDEFGNRAIESNPEKRKEYYKIRDAVHGTQPHRIKVG